MDFHKPRSMVLQIEIGSACTCWNVRAGRPKSQRSKKSSVGDPFGLEFVLYGFGDCGLMSEMGVSGPRSMVLQIKSGNACLCWNIRNGWSKSQRSKNLD